MSDENSAVGRRPIKSRAAGWAQRLSRLLVKSGLSANAISVGSLIFSAAAALGLFFVGNGHVREAWLIFVALCIQ